MSNYHPRKRRPYGHEDYATEPVLQHPTHASSFYSTLSVQERLTLQQAAAILEVPVTELLEIRQRRTQHNPAQNPSSISSSHDAVLPAYGPPQYKRTRLSVDTTMPPNSLRGRTTLPEEKRPSGTHLLAAGDDGQRHASSMLGEPNFFGDISGSIVDSVGGCLPNVFCAPCSDYETPIYQRLQVEDPYNLPVRTMSSMETQHVAISRPPDFPIPAGLGIGSHGYEANQEPDLVAPYLSHYPPFQPHESPNNEAMTYPAISQSFLKTDPSPQVAAPVRHGSPHMIDRTSKRSSVTNDLKHDLNTVESPPSFSPQDSTGLDASLHHVAAQHGFSLSNPMPVDQARALELQDGASSFGVVFPHERAKRGPFKDHKKRQETAHTRKIGSCVRCRMQRIRCEFDPNEPLNENAVCLPCQKVSHNKIFRMPCRRWKITDVRLFKPGQVQGYEWTQRWKDNKADDIGSWASAETKVIRVTEGYTGKFVELRVREFIPQEGDKLDRSWFANGVKKSVRIPAYAITDLDETKVAYDDYIKQGLVETCKRLLGPTEKLLWRTYAMAIKLAGSASTRPRDRSLLSNALDLWMSIRLTTKSFEIIGNETLGMPLNIMDESSPLCGKIPLPPVMGAQIDAVLLNKTLPRLRRETLEVLQEFTQKRQLSSWLTTYLVTFILLHNSALITQHDAGYANKHGMKRRFAREDMVRQYHLGANTLLAYFHYCNKGLHPFSEECRDQDLQTLAQLDESGLQLVHYTRTYAADHKREWEDLWTGGDFENDYYFVGQLFEKEWLPRDTV